MTIGADCQGKKVCDGSFSPTPDCFHEFLSTNFGDVCHMYYYYSCGYYFHARGEKILMVIIFMQEVKKF